MIIIVFGLPGTGKSYFAAKLAQKIGAHHISSDALRKRLYAHPAYSKEEKENIYKLMFNIMYKYMFSKTSVVLDGTFYAAKLRANFIDQARLLNKELAFIEVRAPESIIRQRLSQKRTDSDASYEVYKRIKKQFEPYNREHLIVYSNNSNIQFMLAEATKYIKKFTNKETPSPWTLPNMQKKETFFWTR